MRNLKESKSSSKYELVKCKNSLQGAFFKSENTIRASVKRHLVVRDDDFKILNRGPATSHAYFFNFFRQQAFRYINLTVWRVVSIFGIRQ